MWTYSQGLGILALDGAKFGVGYSGHDAGRNAPAMQALRSIGPLPCGLYTIGTAADHPQLGPCAMPLTPDPANEMFGRGSFYIHGDSLKHPGEASHGCIILSRTLRDAIARSEDRQLTVTE